MGDKKDYYVSMFQSGMLILNVLAVILISGFIYFTTNRIIACYDARTFLDSVETVPENPGKNLIFCIALAIVLLISFGLRQIWQRKDNRLIIATLVADAFACISLVVLLNFNYNGVLLLVFANMIAYVRNGKLKILFVAMAIAGYLVADYDLLSIYMPFYNVTNYINYYPSEIQQYLFSVFNVIKSLNIILFIVYCVYVINSQRGTIEEVNQLYHELQSANEQLKEYADMSERMAKTRERNRLAREIHDTLGHTLTGLTAGLDACIATIDVAPTQTKKQLELLSKVSRDGIKEIRRSVNELRPDALDRLSLEVAIRKMIMEMSTVSDIEIYFETEEKHLKFDEDEENAIYRVIQESITNAVRHGKAKKVWITLKRIDGEILLVIKDDGIGCEDIKCGFGTRHIKERIEMLKGTVSFDGKKGFTVTAHIPIRWGETYD